jgi:hypothetical protein
MSAIERRRARHMGRTRALLVTASVITAMVATTSVSFAQSASPGGAVPIP